MRGARLLLVEDERDSREVLTRALERAGYVCLAAEGPEQALALAKSGPPIEGAVLDVKLGMDDLAGLKLIRPLRAISRAAAIVVVTAFADVDKVKLALNEGASYLLEKPFHAAALLDVLARLLAEMADTAPLVQRALARAKLTEKEAEVAALVLKGLPSGEIASVLEISDKTVRQHLSQVYVKCGVASRSEFFHYVFPS